MATVKKTLYGLENKKTLQPASLDGTRPWLWEWRPAPYWGHHPSKIALMRRFVAEMENEPSLANASEEDVKRHFARLSQYLDTRVVRVKQ